MGTTHIRVEKFGLHVENGWTNQSFPLHYKMRSEHRAAICLLILVLSPSRRGWAEPASNPFPVKFSAYVRSVEKWTLEDVEGLRSLAIDYLQVLKESNGDVAGELRSHAFFAAAGDAFSKSPSIPEAVLLAGRRLLVEWLGGFLKRCRPSPVERSRTIDVLAVSLGVTTREVNRLRAQGVNEKSGGTWNVFHYAEGRLSRLPVPPEKEIANQLGGLLGLQTSIMELIWANCMHPERYVPIADRKRLLLSKGIAESEFADLLLLLPEVDRTR